MGNCQSEPGERLLREMWRNPERLRMPGWRDQYIYCTPCPQEPEDYDASWGDYRNNLSFQVEGTLSWETYKGLVEGVNRGDYDKVWLSTDRGPTLTRTASYDTRTTIKSFMPSVGRAGPSFPPPAPLSRASLSSISPRRNSAWNNNNRPAARQHDARSHDSRSMKGGFLSSGGGWRPAEPAKAAEWRSGASQAMHRRSREAAQEQLANSSRYSKLAMGDARHPVGAAS